MANQTTVAGDIAWSLATSQLTRHRLRIFLQNQGSPCIKCVKVAWKFAVFFSISWLMFVGACGCLRNKDQLVGRQLHCKTVDSGKPTFCLCFCDSKPVFIDSQIFERSHTAPICLHLFQQPITIQEH